MCNTGRMTACKFLMTSWVPTRKAERVSIRHRRVPIAEARAVDDLTGRPGHLGLP